MLKRRKSLVIVAVTLAAIIFFVFVTNKEDGPYGFRFLSGLVPTRVELDGRTSFEVAASDSVRIGAARRELEALGAKRTFRLGSEQWKLSGLDIYLLNGRRRERFLGQGRGVAYVDGKRFQTLMLVPSKRERWWTRLKAALGIE